MRDQTRDTVGGSPRRAAPADPHDCQTLPAPCPGLGAAGGDIVRAEAVQGNQTLTLLAVLRCPRHPMPPAHKRKDPAHGHHDRIPVIVMTQESHDEERDKNWKSPSKEHPREAHLLHADVRNDGERDGEAEGQGAHQGGGQEAAPQPEELR